MIDNTFLSHDESRVIVNHLIDNAGCTQAERHTIKAIHAAFRIFSYWNASHSLRVGVHVERLARLNGHSKVDAARFGISAGLHDIGKLSVPITLLDKVTTLTPYEHSVIRRHVGVDNDWLDEFTSCNLELGKQMIRSHHENQDGSGYPDHLTGKEIHEAVRMARICDTYDALHFDRPYRKGYPREASLMIMDENHQCFDGGFYGMFKANIDHITQI